MYTSAEGYNALVACASWPVALVLLGEALKDQGWGIGGSWSAGEGRESMFQDDFGFICLCDLPSSEESVLRMTFSGYERW